MAVQDLDKLFPQLIEEPANLEEWRNNRVAVLNAMLLHYGAALEQGDFEQVMLFAGAIGRMFSVFSSDINILADKYYPCET